MPGTVFRAWRLLLAFLSVAAMAPKHWHGRRHQQRGHATPQPTAASPLSLPAPTPTPGGIAEQLLAIGVRSASDLRDYFVSEADARSFAAAKGWDADKLVLEWTLASHRAQRALDGLVVVRSSSSTPSSFLPAIAPSLRSSSTGGRPQPAETSVAALAPVVEDAVKLKEDASRLDALQQLKRLWVRLGPAGLLWRSCQADLHWHFLIRKGERLTAGTVKKHVLAVTQWEAWVREHRPERAGEPFSRIDPLDLAQYLDMETAKGATLGTARLASLRWLRIRFGFPFPVEDAVVVDFASAPVAHSVSQATAISPAIFFNVIALVNAVGLECAHEPLLVLFWAMACVRRLHLSKSKLVDGAEGFIMGVCSQGKSKVKGVRPPFTWAVPRLSCLPHCFDFLEDLAQRMGHPSFVIPARVALLGTPARRWLPQAMGHTMTLRILRRVLGAAGVQGSEVEKLSYNSLRRFVPTLGQVFVLSQPECQAIGNWVDDPTRGPDAAAAQSMSVHYGDAKAITSGNAKAKALKKLFKVASKQEGVQAILAGGSQLLDLGDLTWEILGKSHADRVNKKEQKAKRKEPKPAEAKIRGAKQRRTA